MALTPNLCPFCDTRYQFVPELSDVWDTVLSRNDNSFLVPTKGSLLPGWLLVVSRDHLPCLGALDGSNLADLLAHASEAAELLTSAFSAPTIFEHGPANPSSKLTCGVNHLHLHVASLPFSLQDAMLDLFPTITWRLCPSLETLQEIHHAGDEYLYLQEPGCSARMAVVKQPQSQMFRKAIAAALGIPRKWNYTEYPLRLNAEITLSRLF